MMSNKIARKTRVLLIVRTVVVMVNRIIVNRFRKIAGKAEYIKVMVFVNWRYVFVANNRLEWTGEFGEVEGVHFEW